MQRLGFGAALVLILTASSYAWSAPADERLGQSMPSVSGEPGAPPARLATPFPGGGARTAAVVAGLRPDRGVTRGAAETRIYQAASPAVVLVLSNDGLGSGALISADGKIATNLHVVGSADEVGVVFKPSVEGQEIKEADVRTAKVVRRDEVADLALLQVDDVPEGVKPLALGDSTAIQVGEDVHAIGHPTGQTWTYTRGIVSQIRRDFSWKARGGEVSHKATLIQTQTPINPGNSGGPLIDDKLLIVGINTMGAEGEGLNYAVSADDVSALLARGGDRAAPRPAKAMKKACEHVVLAEERLKEDEGVFYEMDGDCDGKQDYVVFVPDDKAKPVFLMFDSNEDGEIDVLMVDEDHDGDIDGALYDTDGDGKSDVRGYFRDGEDEPYRMERIAER